MNDKVMRDVSLDIAKGIGIMLVVIGHCMNGKTFPGIFINAFHMPLFFFISGICFNPQKHKLFLPFFQSRVKQLLLPAVVFSLFNILISQLALTNPISFNTFLWKGFPNAIWFLGVLWLTELVYWAVWHGSKGRRAVIGAVMVFSFAVAAWTSSVHLCEPYRFFTTFAALSFYGVGNLLRQAMLKPVEFSTGKLASAGILFSVVYLLVTYFIGRGIGMSSNDFKLIDILPSFLGIFSLVVVSKWFSLNFMGGIGQSLVWLGRNSLVIMATHMLFIGLSCEYILPIIRGGLVYKVMEQVFVWALCLVIVYFVNHYAKWAIGK